MAGPQVAPRIRPYKVGHESVFVIGVEGVVEDLTDDTITIGGTTYPKVLDRTRGIRYLSMVWPEGDETTCSRDHCDGGCEPTPEAEAVQDELDGLIELVRAEHDAHHGSEPMRFCSHAICRGVDA